jgi:hypothetical protein
MSASLAAGLLIVASVPASWAGTKVEWKGGEDAWENAAMWGGTLPSRTAEARINGTREQSSQSSRSLIMQLTLGVDISKKTFDVALLRADERRCPAACSSWPSGLAL